MVRMPANRSGMVFMEKKQNSIFYRLTAGEISRDRYQQSQYTEKIAVTICKIWDEIYLCVAYIQSISVKVDKVVISRQKLVVFT